MKDIFLEKRINDHLKQYGQHTDGRSKFRLVWAPEQLEWRTGDFQCTFEGMDFGTTLATREVPKYTHLSECYVIEELVFSPILELPNSANGTYEPIYTFESAAGVPLPLTMRVVEIVMYAKMHPRSPEAIHTDIETARQERESRQMQLDIDTIDTSVLQTQLHHGETNYTKGIRNR